MNEELQSLNEELEAEVRRLNEDLERRVEEKAAAVRELREEIVRTATEEQRRIGQELHDTTQQELTGLGLLARNLGDALPAGSDEAALAARLATGIADANQRVRTLARGLIPVPIDSERLVEALGNMAKDIEESHRIPCRFECPIPVRLDDDRVAMQFYRIAREAVGNAVKHAAPTEISVLLDGSGDDLQLEVRDDGSGIDETARQGEGLGLKIMAHRCGMIGGTFELRRRNGGGTVVACCVPWSGLKSA